SAAALAASAGMPVSTARTMLESMTLPMLGDVSGAEDRRGGSWAAPGMVASRAHSWAIAQERSAADLALDFVTPELVLAARVYGLGPSEAAQAARLAIAGSGHLTAMAGTVDRAFIQAMAIDADRRERLATLMTAYPLPTVSSAAVAAAADAGEARADRAEPSRAEPRMTPALAAQPEGGIPPGMPGAVLGVPGAAALGAPGAAAFGASGAAALGAPGAAAFGASGASAFGASGAALGVPGAAAFGVPGGTAFGVDRRAPRGAFLWPSASVAALGLNAAMPEGEVAMSVAALELLAARAVAELGTFAALDVPGLDEIAGSSGASGAVAARRAAGALDAGTVGTLDAGGTAGVAGAAGVAGVAGAPGAAGIATSAGFATDAAAAAAAGVAGGPLGQRAPFAVGARQLGGGAMTGAAAGALGEPGERDVL